MTVKVEDLPGVEPYLISKLKRAGIQSVLDLAVYIPHELVLGGDYNEGNGIAADIETISELVMTAKKALVDSGILSNQRWFKKQLDPDVFYSSIRHIRSFWFSIWHRRCWVKEKATFELNRASMNSISIL